MTTLLSTTYFGPVQWYQKLYRADRVLIERCETFQKQTYRNRCVIAAANGPQVLTVPVVRGNDTENGEQLIANSSISDHGNWRHQHWNALQSAYGDSPFFLYYEDDLRPFFERRWETLFDFNEAIRLTLCQLLDIHPQVDYTSRYEANPACDDYRNAIQPKHPAADADFRPRPYYQVYQERHGFLPNLSILDLLFNMGPESVFYL